MAQVKAPCVSYDFFPLPALLQVLSKLLLTHVLTLVPQLCPSLPVMALQWHLSRCVSVLSMLCWVWPYRLGITTQPLAQLTSLVILISSYLPWGLCVCCAICLGVSPSYLILAPHGLIMASSGLLSRTSFPYCTFHVLAVCLEHSPSCFRVA